MEEELILLDEDRQWAISRVAELEREIQALGPEFHEVFNQSSETWHDNAPFDALRDRQSVLDAELQSLRRVLRSSQPSLPRQSRGVVGVGSLVQLGGKIKRTYRIAGDWTPQAGSQKDGIITVSRKTPIAAALVNKKEGDSVTIGNIEYIIRTIRP